ncbi:MAG: HAD family hydrolase [Lachnospiraceae bacterium]|nr:HAD family hydrolase [Lachnospiraceae bacterium]
MNTILFDLDGTLLPMDQDTYVRQYIRLLAGHFASLGYDAKRVADGLLQATLASMKNETEQTNEEVFWSVFGQAAYPDLRGHELELCRFYAEKHPTLCTAVAPGRNSRRPVDILRAKGYRLVLATNPLFPRMATYQRMSWAGLVPADFACVTTFDNSRRCKPNPAYFTELTEQLGLAPADCLMVGNDMRDDMEAATAAGLETWLITDYLIDRKGEGPEAYRHGTFEEFVAYAESLPPCEG